MRDREVVEASTLAGVATIVSVLAANAIDILAGFQRAASEANMTAKTQLIVDSQADSFEPQITGSLL